MLEPPRDRILEILDVRKSRYDDKTIVIELRGDYCGFRYTRRLPLETALKEYDPKELEAKLREFLRKHRHELAEKILKELLAK